MKNKSSLFLLGVLLVFTMNLPVSAKSVAYKKIVHNKKVYDTVWIDMKDPNVKVTVQVPGGFPLKGESFQNMVAHSHPAAAITGTYFNMTSKVPVGDIVIFGSLVHYGGMGTAMAISGDNQVVFKRVPAGYFVHWDKYETVLAAGPTLLRDGEPDIQPQAERFTDKRILGQAKRCAVGLRPDNILILLTSRGAVSLKDLALAFKSMKCKDAMNLDGGGSSALYCNGKMLENSKRALTNLLVIFDSPKKYNAYRKVSAYTFYQTGKKFRAKGKAFQAMLNYRGATAADSSNASYYKDLAETYSALGWTIWTSWALAKAAAIYDEKGYQDKALYYYMKALEASSNNAGAHKWMAQHYKENGDIKNYTIEEKALLGCLFTGLALRQDLYDPHELERHLWYRFAWEDDQNEVCREKTFGLSLKFPGDWETTHSAPFFLVLQDKDPARKFFMTFEAIKSEVFCDLDKTVSLLREKRQGTIVSEKDFEISGFPAREDIYEAIVFENIEWNFISLYVKRSRWVFVCTLGAPSDSFPEALTAFDVVAKSFVIDKEFEPHL